MDRKPWIDNEPWIEKKPCLVCGKPVLRSYFELCPACYAQYGRRPEWPNWLLLHVQDLDRERKSTAETNRRWRFLNDEYSLDTVEGARRGIKSQEETPLVEVRNNEIVNIPDTQIEHLPNKASPRDPHAPFERRMAKKMAIEQLPELDQQLYWLYWKGYKQAEMARMMGISQGEVSKRLQPLLELLRDSITLE